MTEGYKFATALMCMDGRTQLVADWIKESFGVDFVDSPNPAGPTALILRGDEKIVEHYRNEVMISVNGHHSNLLVVMAHQDCAANPISDQDQIAEITEAIEKIKSEWSLPETVRIIGIWVTKINEDNWEIQPQYDSEKVLV